MALFSRAVLLAQGHGRGVGQGQDFGFDAHGLQGAGEGVGVVGEIGQDEAARPEGLDVLRTERGGRRGRLGPPAALAGLADLVQERLDPRDQPGLGPVLVELEDQVRLPGQDPLDVPQVEGVQAAAEIGQDDRFDPLLPGGPQRGPQGLPVVSPVRGPGPFESLRPVERQEIDGQGGDPELGQVPAQIEVHERVVDRVGTADDGPDKAAGLPGAGDDLPPPGLKPGPEIRLSPTAAS